MEVGSKWDMGATEHYNRPLQQYSLMEEYVGYPPRPDRMYPLGSYVLRGAGCRGCEDPVLYGASAPY
eukprot:2633770-Pleurochrysis_carterae.AAC.1